jgi:hypothetical protein
MAAALEEERRQGMEGHPMPRVGRVFGDQLVTATELNRRGGAILDIALRKPVTITRNDQHFALLRRELVAQLSALSDQASIYAEAMRAIRTVQSGKELYEGHPYRWLHVYGVDHLALMSDELTGALAEVVQGDDAEAVEGVIHEWHESSIAAESEVLNEAFETDPGPIALTSPSNVRGTAES